MARPLKSDQINNDAFYLDKLLAELDRWTQSSSYGDAGSTFFKGLVTDKTQPVLVRTVALQGLAESASRRIKEETTAKVADSTWHDEWRDFLSKIAGTTTGTSLQGQALALMNVSQSQDGVEFGEESWTRIIATILAKDSQSDESSMIEALHLAPSRANHDTLRTSVRRLAENSPSEALQATAIETLARLGNDTDMTWLRTQRARSVKISQALWAARAFLTATPTPH